MPKRLPCGAVWSSSLENDDMSCVTAVERRLLVWPAGEARAGYCQSLRGKWATKLSALQLRLVDCSAGNDGWHRNRLLKARALLYRARNELNERRKS